jgi:hypothetical protein
MNLKKYLPYLFAVFFFLVLTFLYFSPVLSGKTVNMHDDVMSAGNAKEAMDYYQKTGEYTWWTNSVFGGMPSNMIWGSYPYSLSSKLGSFIYSVIPAPVSVIFLLMLGFFIFMISTKRSIWVAVIGAVAYAFGTYNLLYTEAGHLSKILALAYAPGILGGFSLLFNKKYAWGTFVTALFLSLEIYANHLQITYYFIFILLAYFLYEAYKMLKAGEKKALTKTVACLSVAVLVGVGMHTMRLWNNLVYSKESTRGVSELKNSTVGNSGLTKEYAFGWSYGIDETLTLLVPNLMGGGTVGSLSTSSKTYKTLTSNGVDANMAAQFVQQLPLYFGNQSITSGPAYSGILVVFLFILGLLVLPGRFKWIQLGLTLFFIVLAWGSNFPAFNNFLFDTLPGYNKFRAVTMTLVIVHFLLVWGATSTLSYLFDRGAKWEALKKPLSYSAGILVALMLIGYFSVDFVGPRDAEFKASIAQSTGPEFANKLAFALQEDRQAMAWSDIVRGTVLLLLLSAGIWAYYQDKFQKRIFVYVVFLLCAYDLIGVGKRYFNNNDFTEERGQPSTFNPTAADLEILKDNDPNFKVLNVTTSFSSDARDSYFHKSLGGYHGAKLKKTQELFDHQLVTPEGQLNKGVVDMLNTKYLIVNGPNGPMAQRNPDALGNAWFVDSLTVAPNADEELAALKGLQAKSRAVTQANQGLENKVYTLDSTAKVTLVTYAPNRLEYKSQNAAPGFVVFSEIYYRGNKDWKSYVDGKEVPHQKVNYLLRGMELPAGTHEIVFEFKPAAVEKGKYVDLVASIALLLLGAASFIMRSKE